MPTLKKATIERLVLPSTKDLPEAEQAWVELKSKLVVNDLSAMTDKDATTFEQTLKTVSAVISSWNYTDEAGNPLPVTAENVGLLDMDDFMFISDKVGAVMETKEAVSNDEKKESTPTSVPSIAVIK